MGTHGPTRCRSSRRFHGYFSPGATLLHSWPHFRITLSRFCFRGSMAIFYLLHSIECTMGPPELRPQTAQLRGISAPPFEKRGSRHPANICSSQLPLSACHLALNMQRLLTGVTETVLNGHSWKKFVNPTVTRGSTAWPRESHEQEKYGVRYDYDGEQEIGGTMYHKFQMQANARNKIPSTVRNWRSKAEHGTHDVMANVFVPVDGDLRSERGDEFGPDRLNV
ncbi:hypothetical protein BDN71DRAFT_1067110 [Pleurotus eryngii]|uniref:Uncharacterized protein n=1 Tax=Pleurotus eryngii TaxID=5323 RepID=A0A9P5ZTJ1_PLEER|nr:hypothetical protein BDN71DRAFT_1067110 [Pleurotus eryngii]